MTATVAISERARSIAASTTASTNGLRGGTDFVMAICIGRGRRITLILLILGVELTLGVATLCRETGQVNCGRLRELIVDDDDSSA